MDELFVYDDASDDGTPEKISHLARHIIKGNFPNFSRELYNKQRLLESIQKNCAPGDAILRLDADEVLYCSKVELATIIKEAFDAGHDGISFDHINLWRSNQWFREDDNYNTLRPVRIWKLSGDLHFPSSAGLHLTSDPNGLKSIKHVPFPPVIHFGFASFDLILEKYANYRAHWQSGYPLHRLISERTLKVSKLEDLQKSLGARFLELHSQESEADSLVALPQVVWEINALASRSKLAEKSVHPKVTLVSLIYKSIDWLEFQYGELLRLQRDLPAGETEILFIANDPTAEVVRFLEANAIPHKIVSTRASSTEWYINSVYRAYNLGVELSDTEYVFLVNSDMAYSKGALGTLMQKRAPDRFLVSRLVELGHFPTGKYGVERAFGSKPSTFRRRNFQTFSNNLSEVGLHEGGLYMPLLVNRKRFLELGGFPEGNIAADSIKSYVNGLPAEIATKGEKVVPGDQAFMLKAHSRGVVHLTDFESIVYHFQSGEMRFKNKSRTRPRIGIAVVNDSLAGINGEEVLWGELVRRISREGILIVGVETGLPKTPIESIIAPLLQAKKAEKVAKTIAPPRVVLQNASYSFPLFRGARRVSVRQDSPNGRTLKFLQKLVIRFSDSVIANDADYVAIDRGRKTHWLPLPISNIWMSQEMNDRLWTLDSTTSAQTAIFVGAFNTTKGWPQVQALIKNRPEIDWTVVSKYSLDEHGLPADSGPNWRVVRGLTQTQLKELVASSSFLVVASPYETQHLASLEAASLDIPILTTPTGLLGSFGIGVHPFGIVADDLNKGLDDLLANKSFFRPREFVNSFGLVDEAAWHRWVELINFELKASFINHNHGSRVIVFLDRLSSYILNLVRAIYRTWLMPQIASFLRFVRRRIL
jgi:hypothetical protein